jgi:hypothetical protein
MPKHTPQRTMPSSFSYQRLLMRHSDYAHPSI